MHVFAYETGVMGLVFLGLAVVKGWALVDALLRPANAYPAADKLTKIVTRYRISRFLRILGPGVVTNLVLKEHWGRPRPIDVVQFGGDEHFRPWWDPRGDCPKNCSFVAGEPSGAFWTLAGAAVVPPHWRALAYSAALAFGAAVGVLRMAAGAHFFTDWVFAGVFSFLVVWVVHGWLHRWPRTRISDEAIERALERFEAKRA